MPARGILAESPSLAEIPRLPRRISPRLPPTEARRQRASEPEADDDGVRSPRLADQDARLAEQGKTMAEQGRTIVEQDKRIARLGKADLGRVAEALGEPARNRANREPASRSRGGSAAKRPSDRSGKKSSASAGSPRTP